MKLTDTPNRLINEKSPYLLQHAHNPVDWFPWCEEAFAKAKSEDKPVFLSIGYSTCHWCHVMERESFESREVADILNKHYIPIKVDREERPDIDTIYMSVCQAMTGHGGWPLTVILTPDRRPFFAGTYFPRESSRGMPGLMNILEQIAELWQNKKQEILLSSEKISEAVQNNLFTQNPGEITKETLDAAFRYFEENFDERYGGFGRAPKFPAPHNLFFLLRYWKLTGRAKALQMVEHTLESMYLGGIYDHIGYGFSRYSTDRQWLVPHFEKMLYDNALLAIAYLETYQAAGDEKYADMARDIFTYVLRDMTSPEGAFYSAEDADSEGTEGKFYVWSPEEIRAELGEEPGREFCRRYDITEQGNFEGRSIPNLIKSGFGKKNTDVLSRLFRVREKRIHPFKDDKVLTAWNGLMIAALAFGARVLADESHLQAAELAANFVLNKLRDKSGRLMVRYRDGEAALPAYAEDYAYLIWGLIELFQSSGRPGYLETAIELNEDLLKYFRDDQAGGLYQYGSDAEALLTRPKESYDGAMPSANSVAAMNFLRLGRLTGNRKYDDLAKHQLRAFGGSVREAPMSHTFFLTAVAFDLLPPMEMTIVGDPAADETKNLIRAASRIFAPELLLSIKKPGPEGDRLAEINPDLKDRNMVNGKSTVYLCRNFTCLPPETDPALLAEKIKP